MWAWSAVNNPIHKVCVCVCVCVRACVRACVCVRALSVYVCTYLRTYKQNTVQCGWPCCVDSHCNILACWLGSLMTHCKR